MGERTWTADDGTILTEADAAALAADFERDARLGDDWSRWRGIPEHLRTEVDAILAEMAAADDVYAAEVSTLARAGGDTWQALADLLADAGIDPASVRVRLTHSDVGVDQVARHAARDEE